MQVGFVAYNALDRPIESLVAVNEVTSGMNPLANAPDISDDPDQSSNSVNGGVIAVSIPDRRKHKRSVGMTLASSKTVKFPAVRAVNRVPQLTARRKPSETKFRIEYPQEKAFDLESKNYQISARTVPQPKKRSFFSKSMSVIKKPYDWLKALGSKLN